MTAMTSSQIIEYACREGFRAIVTEAMVTEAVAALGRTFTCRDVVEAIPRDAKGCFVSEYLVMLWLDDLVERGCIRWTGARLPRTYETAP